MNANRLSLLAAIVAWGLFVRPALAIVGGQPDTHNRFSNVGTVVFAPPGAVPSPRFTGTLIHPRVFLTAAHALDTFIQNHPWPFTDCYVSFAPDVRDQDGWAWSDIEALIPHPDYEPNGYDPHRNDVGVIILKQPVYTVQPARLAYEGFLDELRADGLLRHPGEGGAYFTVVGYGSTLDFPPPVQTPGDGPRRFAETEYLALTKGFLHTAQNFATGSGGTGYGDSGGPTFWVEPDGTLMLVAVTSGGNLELIGQHVPWRVDNPQTLDFIDWVINTVRPTLP